MALRYYAFCMFTLLGGDISSQNEHSKFVFLWRLVAKACVVSKTSLVRGLPPLYSSRSLLMMKRLLPVLITVKVLY